MIRRHPACDLLEIAGQDGVSYEYVVMRGDIVAFDLIPQARVVRKHGCYVTPLPRSPRTGPDPVEVALGYLLGLWPLTAVVLLVIGLVILAGNSGAP